MGRWNKDLMARLREPIEWARGPGIFGQGSICCACLGATTTRHQTTCASDAGLGKAVGAHVAAGDGPFVVLFG